MNLDFVMSWILLEQIAVELVDLLSFFDGIVKRQNDVGSVEETFDCVLVDENVFGVVGLVVIGE